MKLTDANVYLIEHKILLDLEFWAFANNRDAKATAMYIAGVRDMAQAVVEALREVENG